MTYRFYSIRQICKQLLLVTLLYSVCRLLFFVFNYSSFSQTGTEQILIAFLHGIRFDLSAILYSNIPFMLFAIYADFKTETRKRFSAAKIIFIVFNALAILSNIIDVKFYEFQKKRTTFELFSGENNIIKLIPSYIASYWHLILITGFLIYFLIKGYDKINANAQKEKKKFYVLKTVASFIFLGIAVIGMRGGLQTKPLQMIAASYYGNPNNASLVLNTPFTIFQSINKKPLSRKNYFSETQANKIFNTQRDYTSKFVFDRKNVVVIILESFSNEYIGTMSHQKTCAPFLDSLITESYLLEHAFANGKKSNEAMPSIFASLPSLLNESYINTVYQNNELSSLPNLLKEKGYYTAFYHGGINGSMNFDAFAKKAGFDNYFGMNEYPTIADYDGHWGIYDEPYFEYVSHELGSLPKPFMAGIFSLSSHPPYDLPETRKNDFAEMATAKQKSFRYTDLALKKFFEYAKTKNWYTNTLFVIVPDHTPDADAIAYDTKVAYYQIPIILFDPSSKNLIGKSTQVAQQIDIMPTILDYLHFDHPFMAFGESALRKKQYPYAINYRDGVYQTIDSTHVLQFAENQTLSFYNYQIDHYLKNNLRNNIDAKENKMKEFTAAYIQQFNDALIENKYQSIEDKNSIHH